MKKNQEHQQCADAIRLLALRAIESANSGHPGVVLGFADVLTVLWRQHIRFDITVPNWQNRDRFVLSNGHASALYYAILHCCGFALSVQDLSEFRQAGSRTPGHPERDVSLGIDVTTGPLGQGLANAVGMVFAQQYMQAVSSANSICQSTTASQLVDYFTYCAVGDGCLMEGISHEACALAGRYGLGRLIVCWDDNGISIDGEVNGWAECSVVDRFRAYGWQVIDAIDGHDSHAINQALCLAQACLERPTLLCFKTEIGFGTDLVGSCQVHGKPLGSARVEALRRTLAIDFDGFDVPAEVLHAWQVYHQPGCAVLWTKAFSKSFDPVAMQWDVTDFSQRNKPVDWDGFWNSQLAKMEKIYRQATRHSSQFILQDLLDWFPGLIGGSADLSESTGVLMPEKYYWHAGRKPAKCLHFGVREFAMFAIANGMSTCFGLRPFTSTFLVFSDYGLNAIRMAALMRLPVTFIFSHDSICVGQDGPTHQPVEQLAHLRSIPGLETWRPADRLETVLAWQQILARRDGPSCLVLSRQKLPWLGQRFFQDDITLGAYRLDAHGDRCSGVLIASGSEVCLAQTVRDSLQKQGICVGILSVSCLDRFLRASQADRSRLLSTPGFRFIMEAGSSQCWHQLLIEHGILGFILSVDIFGASSCGLQLYTQYGFQVEYVCRQVVRLFNLSVATEYHAYR